MLCWSTPRQHRGHGRRWTNRLPIWRSFPPTRCGPRWLRRWSGVVRAGSGGWRVPFSTLKQHRLNGGSGGRIPRKQHVETRLLRVDMLGMLVVRGICWWFVRFIASTDWLMVHGTGSGQCNPTNRWTNISPNQYMSHSTTCCVFSRP